MGYLNVLLESRKQGEKTKISVRKYCLRTGFELDAFHMHIV